MPAPTACTSARTTRRPRQARAAVGPDRIVGRSTHAPAQADAAQADPDVDYLAVGPVHATPTKPGPPGRRARATSRTRRARSRKPWFAIGGLDAQQRRRRVAGGARSGSWSCARSPRHPTPRPPRASCGRLLGGRVGAATAVSGAPPAARPRRSPRPAELDPSDGVRTVPRAGSRPRTAARRCARAMARGYARSRARNDAAREALEPLAARRAAAAVTVAAIVAG